ncbi:Clavaminate synthase-like protein [Xylariaceae sp. FL0016]|nr:Clavaminate synthase-like protein [Xylariaceae sp. FL0016]
MTVNGPSKPTLAKQDYRPIADLDTVVFSKVLDRDPDQIKILLSACENVGFFYLDISDQYSTTMLDNLDKLNSVMKGWFDQPDSVKRRELAISMASHGYKPIGSQAGTHGGRDGWEVLKTGSFELAGRWGLAPIVEDNYETFHNFQRQCHYVTRTLLDRLSNAMGLKGEQSLNRFHRSDCPSKSALAFLHYIPTDPTGENAGHNMHTDYGTLTLVFAPQRGLQALVPRTPGKTELAWQHVEPRPGCAIVNVADALRFLTHDRLRSAVHQVHPLPGQDRYSVTYFLRPSDDTEIVDGEGQHINVMDWYQKKNNMYEASYKSQDRSLLIGGMYNGV